MHTHTRLCVCKIFNEQIKHVANNKANASRYNDFVKFYWYNYMAYHQIWKLYLFIEDLKKSEKVELRLK